MELILTMLLVLGWWSWISFVLGLIVGKYLSSIGGD